MNFPDAAGRPDAVPRQTAIPSGDGWIVLSLYGGEEAWRRGKVVILCHGFTGHRIEGRRLFVRLARRLVESGLAVCTFDYRGNGESTGEFEAMSVTSLLEDANAAVEFLQKQTGPAPLRLGVLGYSMGGLVASYLARDRPGAIQAVVLWAAVACSSKVLRGFLGCSVPEALQRYEFPVERDGWRLGRRFLEELDETCSSKALADARVPTLVLHAQDDKTVSVDNATEFRLNLKSAGVEHEVEILRRGGHGFIVQHIEENLFEKTTAYFVNRL
jgi:pimeloyl-ACP methyl ester carboxylesterase